MSFSGSFYKTPCWCTNPPLAYASTDGLPKYYVDIVIAGYWYSTPPELYTVRGSPMTVTSFDGNFGNLAYYYRVYTKDVMSSPIQKANEREIVCNMEFGIMTWDDVIPQVYHRDTNLPLRVTRIKRDAGKTLWKVHGCK